MDSFRGRGLRVHISAAALTGIPSCGLAVDGWSHRHLETESLLTPAHALLYGTVSLLGITLVAEMLRNRARGYGFMNLLPRGYKLAVLGAAGAAIGAPLDFLWHQMRGFEVGIDGLVSPTHLFIAANAALLITGPLRSGIRSQPAPRLKDQMPLLLSAAALFMLLQFFTQYAIAFDAGFSKAMAPIGYQDASTSGNLAQLTTVFYREALGVFAILLRATLLGGFIVFLLRSVRLAPGAFTIFFVCGLAIIFIMIANDPTTYAINAAAAVGGGVFADVLYRVSPPDKSESRFLWFTPLVLTFYFALFFLLEATAGGGLWWDANFVVGAIAISILIGLLLGVFASAPVAKARSV